MFKSMLMAVTGLAALSFTVAGPAANAQKSCRTLGVDYACSGGGGGELNLKCPDGMSGPQCCGQLRTSVQHLCPNGLSTYRCGCTTFCNAAGQCWTPDSTTANEHSGQNDQEGRMGAPVNGNGQLHCARINYRTRCRNRRRYSGLYRCAAGETTMACCRRRLARICFSIGNVDWPRTTCYCMEPGTGPDAG